MALNFELVVSNQLFSVVLVTLKVIQNKRSLVFGGICESWIQFLFKFCFKDHSQNVKIVRSLIV